MNSCLYEGTVRHRRHGAVDHEFRHRLLMTYLDLDELPWCLDASRLWSARGPAVAWFRRADHLGDADTPLADAVRELVSDRTGIHASGPVRLLTNLRQFGHCFNPVSFYYCFDGAAPGERERGDTASEAVAASGERMVATVAHVTNTPWGEQHSYVMPAAGAFDRGSAALVAGSVRKRLHVSPLMGMDHTYEWSMTVPARRLSVHISSRTPAGDRAFDATLSLSRRELSASQLRRAIARYPLPTVAILARIYGHALRLRCKGARYHPHPRDRAAA